jgi:hypothetical protein
MSVGSFLRIEERPLRIGPDIVREEMINGRECSLQRRENGKRREEKRRERNTC